MCLCNHPEWPAIGIPFVPQLLELASSAAYDFQVLSWKSRVVKPSDFSKTDRCPKKVNAALAPLVAQQDKDAKTAKGMAKDSSLYTGMY